MLAQRLAGHLPPKKTANSTASDEAPVAPVGLLQSLISEQKVKVDCKEKLKPKEEKKVLSKEEQEREEAMKKVEAVK